MKRFLPKFSLLTLASISLFLTASLFGSPQPAKAAYQAANLIGDPVFLDSNAMSAGSIQSFLNNKGSYLRNHSYKEVCDTDYMKDHYGHCGQTVSAATVIYDAGKAYGLNPRVILATLQKEQSLVTDSSPSSSQITFAMGYGCPDSGSCSFPGFFTQVDWGTWQLRRNYETSSGHTWLGATPSSYACKGSTRYYSPGLYAGNAVKFYDNNGTRYATVTLANASTASLYCYTPHTYNNPHGSNGMPVAGTRGEFFSDSYWFVHYFELWWGSTQYPWASDITSRSVYASQAHCNANTNSLTMPSPQKSTGPKYWIKITAKNVGFKTWKDDFLRVAAYNADSQKFYDTSWLTSTRTAALSNGSVGPNETGTFDCFAVKAPSLDKAYSLEFRLRVSGYGYLAYDPKTRYGITVSNNYNGQLTQNSTYLDSAHSRLVDIAKTWVYPNQRIYLVVKAKNIGSQSWGQAYTKVGTDLAANRASVFHDTDWLSTSRADQLDQSSVAHGSSGSFSFSMKAPTSTGSYDEHFKLVADGQTDPWMPAGGFRRSIKVVATEPNKLYSRQRLYKLYKLYSSNRDYKLTLQSDGNLVLHSYATRKNVWATNTHGQPAAYLEMRSDGDLRLISTSGKTLWRSHTKSHGAHLYLRYDGNLVIRSSSGSVIWQTHTRHK